VVALCAVAFAVGCDSAAGRASARVAVEVMTRGDTSVVEVRGLDPAAARRLARLAPNDTAWPRLVAVYVEQPSGAATPREPVATPPVVGRYTAADDRIRFEPRFPVVDGVAYRVEVDTAALARAGRGPATRDEAAEPLIHRFARPSVPKPRTTRIVSVHPSLAVLPSNTLRWYVETSAPMEPGNALRHIRLLDESGREVAGAFLGLEQELWDPARRRLTLLFDPGRVKRGVRTNVEAGTPLVAGRRYRLVIDDGWTDGTGAPLASGFAHDFSAVAADRRSPDPGEWQLVAPNAGTRASLRVAFGEALDHALAERLLVVHDARGAVMGGSAELAANDSAWVFSPEQEWRAGDYTLRVSGALEDLAGNNIARLFDVDRRSDSAGIERDVAGSTRTVRFRVPPPD
jgi:hypothetical protein